MHHLPTMEKVTVWYDGSCPLCRREIVLMHRLDTRSAIDFIDLESQDAACPLDKADLLARFHALENGQLLSGAAAFAAMWRAIPRLRLLGLAARQPVVLFALERLYRIFLRVRPRLQRLVTRLDAAAAAHRPQTPAT
ncbi:thiol-disulfide oxidoreductase DCC family protein [Lichenihabitans psoromatis]|uniref:thiol-disulfide oxidoreductase DCC family protein n=1 Tax=Lichenihabitans psoromatis TaxID=2528642 RepID=UPI001FDFF719|nr:DUF393 domain-containing protein [Lichenihabitans psoromatis]